MRPTRLKNLSIFEFKNRKKRDFRDFAIFDFLVDGEIV